MSENVDDIKAYILYPQKPYVLMGETSERWLDLGSAVTPPQISILMSSWLHAMSGGRASQRSCGTGGTSAQGPFQASWIL